MKRIAIRLTVAASSLAAILVAGGAGWNMR